MKKVKRDFKPVDNPPSSTPQKQSVTLGGLVRYYDNGWRVGTLTEFNKKEAKVQPLLTYNGRQPRGYWYPIAELEAVEDKRNAISN